MDSLGKSPLLSKTLWVNVLAVVAMLVQGQTGFIIDAEAQIALLGVINLVLRAVTKEPLNWKSTQNQSGKSNLDLLRVMAGFSLGLALVMVLSGCAAFQEKRGLATKALLTTKEAIVGIAEAADQLCSQGTLTQSQCDEVATVYEQAKAGYDAAADLLVVAVKSDSDDAWQNYQILNDHFYQLYSDMTAIAIKFNLLSDVEASQ